MSLENNSQHSEADDRDEQQLSVLLRAIDVDTLPPDHQLLAALRQRTLETVAKEATPPIPASPLRKFGLRGLAVLAATAAMIAIGVTLSIQNSANAAPAFSEVLEKLHDAKTLHLRLIGEGVVDVWIRDPGVVRLEATPQFYRIASGSHLWTIDERTNTVTTEESPAYLNHPKPVDLLGFLDDRIGDAKPLLTARPSEQVDYGGSRCFVYRAEVESNLSHPIAPNAPRANAPIQSRRLQIEAFVDAHSNQLIDIVARLAGQPKTGRPLAELQLVAMNPPVDESKFIVPKTLTEDGRIGKVIDAQGLITLRPALAARWTPIGRETLLKMGDWIRTDIRGANAAKLRLSSDVELTLGPGTLLECVSPVKVRLHTGEAQAVIPRQQEPVAFELLGPREGSRKFAAPAKQLLRVDREEKLVDVKQQPAWLKGFEGTSNNESLGSLIVNLPDGRNEPLTVGYHKVNVEIRDQIARTTIEESFVNHTPSRLEGVFYFPLPPDASISGFGMWIGNDLIEADVVEKQRAREIYETILREKRDPGLLEWTSGNLFKARVFPIEANAEKRIKIVYTQVLPLRANRYRYSYGLQSELLRTKPLRELSLSVLVNSALPLKSVTCPTHSVRVQQTGNSAQVDFAAQEYTPERDFEVVCEINGRNSDVVLVPHRRGEDGYFILQLTPPAREGNWQREILPDGKPLQLVLLCDTSASMDADKRKQQAEFIAAILSSLGEKDRFRLAVADVETTWVSPEPMAATPENLVKVQEFLDGRVSLGWTNLDQAFAAVLKQAPADAQIIYIGDGLATAGETDPAAFVKQLGRSLSSVQVAPAGIHAVTVGNTFESTAMRGIAAVGHGSVRAISGEQTPQIVARELLNEIAQPGLRDLNIEFRGLKVAAVYPEVLPTVPAGTQQILVGRYLPAGMDQQGEVIVTGKLGNEPVRYAAKVDLKDAEEGNSFIPRLWARSHLDHLLAQGQSPAVRDQIIALSEEFHIITPYTSLLVLETDADRERFGVKQRYEMRNGEQFFATGRDNANYELLQQQMKRAGDWRIGLRRQVLASLATLGRNPQILQQQIQGFNQSFDFSISQAHEWRGQHGAIRGAGLPASGVWGPMGALTKSGEGSLELADVNGFLGDALVTGSGMITDAWTAQDRRAGGFGGGGGGFDESGGARSSDSIFETEADLSAFDKQFESAVRWDADSDFKGSIADAERERFLTDGTNKQKLSWFGEEPLETNRPMSARSEMLASSVYPVADLMLPIYETTTRDIGYTIAKPVYERPNRWSRFPLYGQPNYTAWLDTLFPPLAGPQPKPRLQKDPEGWSAEAIALSKSLLRTEALLKLTGGIELRRTSDTFDPRWNRRTSHHTDLALYSPTGWLTRPTDAHGQTLVDYCDGKERGVYSFALLLGRTRKTVERDLQTPPLALIDGSLFALHDSAYRDLQARVEKVGDNQAKLILTTKNSKLEHHFLIDTIKHALVKHEILDDGKVTSATTFSDLAEIAGTWWARNVVTTDGKGRNTGETKLEIAQLEKAQYGARLNDELAAKPQVAFLHLPFVPLKTAQQRVADGSAGFDDRITMMLYNSTLQQWDELFKQLDTAEKLAADKPGARWLRTILLATSRRNEEARQRLLDEARKLSAGKQQDEIYLADFIFGQAQSVATAAEQLEFINLLQPVADRQPAELDIKSRWQDRLLGCSEALGRTDEALALRRTLAEHLPWEVNRQIDYARRLLQVGQPEAAYAWLQKELDRPIERENYEDEQLHTAYADFYRTQARWEDLLRFTATWIKRNPQYQSAYAQHLSALVFNDQMNEANKLAEQWLKDAQIDGQLPADLRARLDAAIAFAQGNGYNLSFYRMDERWQEPLAQVVRFFITHKHHFDIAQGIFNNRISGTEAGDRLRGYFLELLRTKSDDLAPQQVGALVSWSLSGRIEVAEPINGRKQQDAGEIPIAIWQRIAAALGQRWTASADQEAKNQLGEALRTIYASRFSDTELLPFLRERITTAPKEFKQSYIAALFDTLLGRPWSEKIEDEEFQLLRQLSDADDPSDRLAAEAPALYRLVDAMISARRRQAEQEFRDQGQVDQLTRTELRKKLTEIDTAARTGMAVRLANEAAKETGPLAPWLRMEQAYLEVQLDQNLAKVEEQCWQLLDVAPPKPEVKADDDAIDDETISRWRKQFYDAVLRQRAFVTVMNLAVRRNAPPQSIKRLEQYIGAGIARGDDLVAYWRMVQFQLLVALDQPDELERQLRDWIRTDVSTASWRKALATLLAERGKLDEAIGLFEAAEKDHLLSAVDYRMLSDWYLASARREAYERARIAAFKELPEYALSNSLYGARNRWLGNSRPLLSELDENTLFTLRALFEKSSNPENYLWQLRELYAACRDFRLLQMLPDAVLGRSPQQVYSLLQNLQSQVLVELRNEATADEIMARIKKLRNGERTPTDLRALDLLEALIERRSSEVLNQPGPHVEASVAALKRAFDRQWGVGELRMMSSFLKNLGTLPQPALVAEQLREFRELQKLAPAASRDHLQITDDLCNALFWSYGRHDQAIEEMEAEVRGYDLTHRGQWPNDDNAILGSYVHLLEGATRHAQGETLLQKYLAHPENDDQRRWLKDRLLALYNDALDHDGEVTLGKGNALFLNIVAESQRQIKVAPDENVRQSLVARLSSTFDIAHRHKLSGTADELRRFAFETMPAVLKKQQQQYRSTVTAPTNVIAEVLGAKGVLQYIVERMEQYPQRLDMGWENSWNTLGAELAHWRYAAQVEQKLDIADLEPRILSLAIAELKRDLRSGEHRNASIYHRANSNNTNWFWAAKADDFAHVSEEVYSDNKTSGRRVMNVASYFRDGLGRPARAIELLFVAHRNGILDEAGQNQLVDWLHWERRFAESIALLEPLVKAHPDSMHHRCLLMTAYHQSQRPEQLRDLIAQIDTHFHGGGRWTEGSVAEFGKTCVGCQLYEKAVGYLGEAISLHQCASGGRVLNDAGLSDLYNYLADAHSALGHTKEAVDAASGAIVCWGPQQSQRRDALNKLKAVLENAKDLPVYVEHLDAEAAESGQDSPILRKAVAQVLQARQNFKQAVAQYEQAIQLQPNDKELYQGLIACYDALGNRAEATRQLERLIELERHEIALYQQLADRLSDHPAQAERAVTSIIEVGLQEAENHAALAEIRQKQNRWDEAIHEWQEVAKLRSLEPTGLLKLTEAQLHQQQWAAARQSIEKLQRTEWPTRFGDVNNQTRQLQEKLPK